MAAQLIGYAALLLYISMFWQKSRRLLLLFGMAESILYGIHYCLLDGLTGGIGAFVLRTGACPGLCALRMTLIGLAIGIFGGF